MTELALPAKVIIWAVPVVFAITVHEVAHGWVAKLLGDRTAEMLGRLTLNPVKHIDPIGTIVVPGLLLLAGGILMGWAKPVPVAARNLRRPKQDMALVAAAGPAAHLLMAFAWTLVVKVGLIYHAALGVTSVMLVAMGVAGIAINTSLLVLNLLPIPPLDGGRVLVGVLPVGAARALARLEPYGLVVLLVLLFTGVLARVIGPAIFSVEAALLSLLGIPMQTFHTVLLMLLGRG